MNNLKLPMFALVFVTLGSANVWAQPWQDCPGTNHPCHMHWQQNPDWYRMHCDQLEKEFEARQHMTPEQLKQLGPTPIDEVEQAYGCSEVGGGRLGA